MLGKAAAAAMAKVHKKSAMDGFFYFNGAEMMGPYVGDEGKWVRQCFAKADEFSQRNGYPAVLFFDECDSMLPDRRHSPRWVVEGVNTFLALMDGMKPCNAFIILATNDHKTLDEAAIRAGRIDKKIYVGRPEKAAVFAILKSGLSKKPISGGLDPITLADFAIAQLFAESRVVGDKELHQFLNGATAVNVVERAALLAFKKAIQSGVTDVAGLGIGMEEIRESVDAIHQETKALKDEEATQPGRTATVEAHIRITESDNGESMMGEK
jgi:SpoVK/Ycf46/Vps4 family AAA+-type ATPase